MTDHARAIEAGARAAFKAAHKHLDLTEDKDAWGRPVFVHLHVESMWCGWKAALASGALVPAIAVAAMRERACDLIKSWTNHSKMQLHAGEMTAQERRTTEAILNAVWQQVRQLDTAPASGDYVVVPRQPTMAMKKAAAYYLGSVDVDAAWTAMLTAASRTGGGK